MMGKGIVDSQERKGKENERHNGMAWYGVGVVFLYDICIC